MYITTGTTSTDMFIRHEDGRYNDKNIKTNKQSHTYTNTHTHTHTPMVKVLFVMGVL